jgi:erythromycin esterase-like protein
MALLAAFAAFFLSIAVSGALWANVGAGLLAFACSMWFLLPHSRRRAFIAIGGAVCLLALVSAPTVVDRLRGRPHPEPEELVRQIGRTAIPLHSVDPGNGFTDLAPLDRIWQGVRVVALGEATHGTSEFFRMKHRLTEFLVARLGFRYFALELDARRAKPIDEYIQGERGNNPVAGLGWPWGTREMAAMVDWMRNYNASVPTAARVHFRGIDYQGERRDFRMAQNTLTLLDRLDPGSRVVLWAHNTHVSSGPGWMGSYLKSALHNQIYLTGFEFHHGRFTSNLNWVRTYEAEPADDGYYAAALQRIGAPILFLDFRTMEDDPAVDAWLRQPRFAHELQEAHGLLRLNPAWVRTDESWPSLFDGIVYINESTPARLF